MTMIFSLLLLGLISTALTDHHCQGYDHTRYLDTDKTYLLCWKVDWPTETITFKVQADTLGWVGFGISPDGHMPGSDMVIGWQKSGSGYLQDRFATDRVMPPVDEKQNVELLSSSESDGKTTLEFRRKLQACEPKDLPIESGTTRIVWSYNYADPTSVDSVPIHDKKGSTSIGLLSGTGSVQAADLTGTYEHYDLLNKNVSVPSVDTTYWCQPLKLPVIANGAHIIRYEPVIQPGHEILVHHILAYECNADIDPYLNVAGSCDSGSLPGVVRRCRGGQPLLAWAVGGQGTTLPADIGLPFSGTNGPKYVVMETHYNNPQMKADFIDASGMRMYYTQSKRKYDAQILEFGHKVSTNEIELLLPPRMSNIVTENLCPGVCTQQALPSGGVNVFATFLHSHTAGKRIWVKHIRNSTELPEIDRNDHYDFNFQDITLLRRETNIQPGDDIQVFCDYDTSKRAEVTIGGLGTMNEMCLAYLFVYPVPRLRTCLSQIPYDDLTVFIQDAYSNGWASATDYNSATNNYERRSAVTQTVKNGLDFTSEQSRSSWRQFWNSRNRQFDCQGLNHVDLLPFNVDDEITLPNVTQPLNTAPPPMASSCLTATGKPRPGTGQLNTGIVATVETTDGNGSHVQSASLVLLALSLLVFTLRQFD